MKVLFPAQAQVKASMGLGQQKVGHNEYVSLKTEAAVDNGLANIINARISSKTRQ